MKYLKLFEQYNEITIRDVAWLYFLQHLYGGKMEIKSWKDDNRMEVKCDESLRKFKCVTIGDDFYRSSDECGKVVDEWFGCETFKESLRMKNKLSDYKNKNTFYGYDIDKIPYELYIRFKHPSIDKSFNSMQNIFAEHWNSQMCMENNIKEFLKNEHIKEWNFQNFFEIFPDEPKTFKVYRGIKDDYNEKYNKEGYSCWTTSKTQAERFAKFHFTGGKQFTPEYADNSIILEADVSLDNVAVFIGGSEGEAILKNPVNITNIEKIEEIKEIK